MEITFDNQKPIKGHLVLLPLEKNGLLYLVENLEETKKLIRQAGSLAGIEIISGKITADYLYLYITYPSFLNIDGIAAVYQKESAKLISSAFPANFAPGKELWKEDYLAVLSSSDAAGRALRSVAVPFFEEWISNIENKVPTMLKHKVLVTGGAGFIGSNLADELIRQGHEVVIIDDLSAGKKENVNPRAKFYLADVCDREKIDQIFAEEKFDYVHHLAAQIYVRKSLAEPELDVKINISGGINILEACRKHNVKKIIFPSSAAVYGDAKNIPTKETDEVNPISPYGINKLTFEKYLQYYNLVYKLPYVACRFSNAFGPRQYCGGESGVISIFVDDAVNGRQSSVFGDGKNTRDYVYVDDLVQALIAAMNYNGSGIFNISNNKEISLLEIINNIESAAGRKLNLVFGPERAGDILRASLDSRKAIAELGWTPKVDIKEGIRRTVEWSMKNKINC